MLMLVYILLYQCVIVIYSQPNVLIPSDGRHPLDIEPFLINIRIPNVDLCQTISTSDCRSLVDQLFKCQQIIFNDPGFSYQQYKANLDVHQQILAKYQSICEGTENDYLVNHSFDLKKD